MKAFVLAENGDAARELCAGARTLSEEVILVCAGLEPITGVADKVLVIDIPENALVEDAYVTVNQLFDKEQPGMVIVEPTRRMRALAGRLAAHAKTAVMTDAVKIEYDIATNLYFGGIGQRKTRVKEGTRIYTIGSGVFSETEASGGDIVESVAFEAPAAMMVKKSVQPIASGGADLAKADIVVGAGRGFAEENELEIARNLASRIDGELACSRPLTEGVDWMPKGSYIGVSGLMLSPKVYVACGISGQMQHMVGIARANTIVAINKDKNAPIFKQCDIGIVGDIKHVIPALTSAL